MQFGIGEIIFLAIVLTLIFSASKMSALGNAFGKFVHSFRQASKKDDFIDLPMQTTSHTPKPTTNSTQTTTQNQKHT